MCASLITCLIDRYLDDNATIDAISSRLREVCPSLYSSDDATCSKVRVDHACFVSFNVFDFSVVELLD